MNRCEWAKGALMTEYHDTEWGVAHHDDRDLFELLILEGAQAGLSWEIVLRKRDHFREAFDRFDAGRIAVYDEKKVAALMADSGIIRNRLKIEAAIKNARAFLALREEFGSFDKYLWQFVDYEPVKNGWISLREVPSSTPESDSMSKALKKRGFSFVGTTICYAFMQAAGMVNDHVVDCFRYRELVQNRTPHAPPTVSK